MKLKLFNDPEHTHDVLLQLGVGPDFNLKDVPMSEAANILPGHLQQGIVLEVGRNVKKCKVGDQVVAHSWVLHRAITLEGITYVVTEDSNLLGLVEVPTEAIVYNLSIL